MVDVVELSPDRLLFTDGTLGTVKGLRLNGGFLEVVDSSLTRIGMVNNFISGLYSALPAAGEEFRIYYATDQKKFHYDTGSAWVPLSGGYPSHFRAYRSGSHQVVSTGTDTKMQFDGVLFDGLNEYDETTNYRFTATEDGVYHVVYKIFTNDDVGDGNELETNVKLNGSFTLVGAPHRVFRGAVSSSICMGLVDMDASDYLEFYCWQNSGGNITIQNNIYYTHASVHRVY